METDDVVQSSPRSQKKMTRRVPLLDLSAQNGPLHAELMTALERVVRSGQFILGPEVEGFERELAAAARVKHAVGLSSGTDAILVALMALGIGHGDEVVTTPYSFFATAGAIARLGAEPVFVDIDPATFNIDPDAAADSIGPDCKAVVPVSLFGRPAPRIPTTVPVIEDNAQTIGAAPLIGVAGCLSFFPSKNLGALGDAGAFYTDDDALADRVRLLRGHGARPKYVHHAVGGNFRIDALQAAALRVKLPHLSHWTEARRLHATRYRQLFAASPRIPPEVVLPADDPAHIYNQFVIRAPRRDELRKHLEMSGVGTEVYYPMPFHLMPCFKDLGYGEGSFPEAERASRESLAIPVGPGLTAGDQAYVVDQIASFY
jgi:dTDP-4-amino-4,6-dideoxygalactose transaminase